jgi:hypothetical protein
MSAQQQRHLEVDVQPFDRPPEGVDRLGALERRASTDWRGWDVVDVDEDVRYAGAARGSGARRGRGSSSPGTDSHVVKRERSEKPGSPW